MQITDKNHIIFQTKKRIEDAINNVLWEKYLEEVPEKDRLLFCFEEYKKTFTIKAVYEEKELYIEMKQKLN